MYPTNPQYRHSIANKFYPPENGGHKFTPILINGEPQFESGNKAIVFKVTDDVSNKVKALKLFLKDDKERFNRYTEISKYLNQFNSKYFVGFNFIEKFIYVEVNTNNSDNYFPGLIMEWAEGMTLGTKIKELCESDNKNEIKKICTSFKELSLFLLQNEIGHGDLKHDNIIVGDKNDLKLIDYDGLYTPSFKGQFSNELGTDSFQHPLRKSSDYNSRIDHFSILTIYVSLLALSLHPSLYNIYNDQQNLLFSKEDFLDPENSKLFEFLSQEIETKALTFFIKQSLTKNDIYIDNILDLLNGNFPKPKIVISHSPEEFLVGDLVKISWTTENVGTLHVNGVMHPLQGFIEEIVTKKEDFLFEYSNNYENKKLVYSIKGIPEPEIVLFLANNTAIKHDENLVLKWRAKNYKTISIRYDDSLFDVTNSRDFVIKGLKKNTTVSLVLTAKINERQTEQSIQVDVCYPISLQIKQDKLITFPNRPVLLNIQCENAEYVTLKPLNIDLTGKSEYEIKTELDLDYVIIAENKRYRESVRSRIEVLKPGTFSRRIIDLPKIEFKVPLPKLSRFQVEHALPRPNTKDVISRKLTGMLTQLKIFKIR